MGLGVGGWRSRLPSPGSRLPMSVSGQTPTEVHLNGSSPAIPSGGLPVTFQGGTPYPDPNNPTLGVTDVSAYVAIPSPAKGTILVYNGSAWVPLAVGTDGQVLTAESGQSTGLEWMAASGGGGGSGAAWFAGSGLPGTISGQANGDFYLETSGTGNVYELVAGSWVLQCSILGATGATGAAGSNGSNGSAGARGSLWYTGSGAPGTIGGQANGDMYLDTASGAVYELVSGTWTLECNITGPTGASGSSSGCPALSAFSWVNQGSNGAATQVVTGGPIMLTITDNSALNWRLLAVSQPSTPYKLQAQFRAITTPWANSQTIGFYFYDGTKLLGIEYLSQLAGGVFRAERITSVTSDDATMATLNTQSTTQIISPVPSPFWVQLRNNGSTLYLDYGLDGANFINLYSEAVGAWLTPTKICFGGISITSTSTNYIINNLMVWKTVGNATL